MGAATKGKALGQGGHSVLMCSSDLWGTITSLSPMRREGASGLKGTRLLLTLSSGSSSESVGQED